MVTTKTEGCHQNSQQGHLSQPGGVGEGPRRSPGKVTCQLSLKEKEEERGKGRKGGGGAGGRQLSGLRGMDMHGMDSKEDKKTLGMWVLESVLWLKQKGACA